MTTLDFEVRIVTLVSFLERFERVFDFRPDGHQNELQEQIEALARRFCMFSLKNPYCLDYKPSIIAAACLLIAINLRQSPISDTIGINQLSPHATLIHPQDTESQQLFSMRSQSTTLFDQTEPSNSSLKLWSTFINEVTGITTDDIRPCYLALLTSLNRIEFAGKLTQDSSLWNC